MREASLMNAEEQKRLLERLGLLVHLTEARGCTKHEAALAQQKLGAAVQKYNLTLSFGQAQQQSANDSEKLRQHWEAWANAKIQEEMARYRQAARQWAENKNGTRTRSSFQSEEDPYEYGEVEVIGATEKALLLKNEDGTTFWIPKSQLREDCRDWTEGDSGTLYTSAWWARKEGWEDAE